MQLKDKNNLQRFHTWSMVPMLPYSALYSVVGQYCWGKLTVEVFEGLTCTVQSKHPSMSFLSSLYSRNVIKVSVHYAVVPLRWNFFCGFFFLLKGHCGKPNVANVLKDKIKMDLRYLPVCMQNWSSNSLRTRLSLRFSNRVVLRWSSSSDLPKEKRSLESSANQNEFEICSQTQTRPGGFVQRRHCGSLHLESLFLLQRGHQRWRGLQIRRFIWKHTPGRLEPGWLLLFGTLFIRALLFFL